MKRMTVLLMAVFLLSVIDASARLCTVKEITHHDLEIGQVFKDSGYDPSEWPIDKVFLLDYLSPNYNGSNISYSDYIVPNDEVVQWFIDRMYIKNRIVFNKTSKRYEKEFQGLLFVKTGKPLNITYQNFKVEYPQFKKQDYFQTVNYTLAHGAGNCHDLANTMCSLFIAMRLPAMVIYGFKILPDGTYECHLWVEVKVDGKIYDVDFCGISERTDYFLGFKKWQMFNDTQDLTYYNPRWIH